jgi:hypothetical protein
VTENQSVYIPLGAVHRMENPGKVPMVLIEVQTGSYLGEDDIIRYEDVYSRGSRGCMAAQLGRRHRGGGIAPLCKLVSCARGCRCLVIPDHGRP